MLQINKYPEIKYWRSLINRPSILQEDLEAQVKLIFNDIEQNGDAAVADYTLKYDGVQLETFLVSPSELNASKNLLTDELIAAIELAKKNIEKFHVSQIENSNVIETSIGVSCWRENRPIENIGIYIPGGTAPLFSTVLMLGIPAKIAGCKEIILCTPPNKEGKINPAILFTAQLLGINKILKIGGIQAIAALSLGTQTVIKVDKIFGPGNQYVTAAKKYALNYKVAIDMPAGPSELLIIADKYSNAEFVAADFLSQAEHGTDSQVILLSDCEDKLVEIIQHILSQVEEIPRKAIALKAIENSSIILLKNIDACLDFSNLYAPEHLILAVEKPINFVSSIQHAGSVFLGKYSCESAGDYASGTNHTLPTNGYARNYSGVSLDSFVKKITFQEISEIGIQNIGPSIELMADAEQLVAHKNAVSVRLKSLNKDV